MKEQHLKLTDLITNCDETNMWHLGLNNTDTKSIVNLIGLIMVFTKFQIFTGVKVSNLSILSPCHASPLSNFPGTLHHSSLTIVLSTIAKESKYIQLRLCHIFIELDFIKNIFIYFSTYCMFYVF